MAPNANNYIYWHMPNNVKAGRRTSPKLVARKWLGEIVRDCLSQACTWLVRALTVSVRQSGNTCVGVD